MSVVIERIENGWLITNGTSVQKAVLSEQDLLEEVLVLCCGRSEYFGGDSYGKVRLILKEPKESRGKE